jgi:hypothetical protein
MTPLEQRKLNDMNRQNSNWCGIAILRMKEAKNRLNPNEPLGEQATEALESFIAQLESIKSELSIGNQQKNS